MLLNGQELKIKPVLALDFSELRTLFADYYTSGLDANKKEYKKALKSLLTCALQRTDPKLSTDPSPLIAGPNALDVDEVDDLIFAAGGNRGKVLRLLRDEIVNFMKMTLTDGGLDSLSLSPPEPELPSGT